MAKREAKGTRPTAPLRTRLRPRRQLARARIGLRRVRPGEQILPLITAAGIGAVCGYASIGFRWMIEIAQRLAFGVAGERLPEQVGALPWWHLLLAITLGGLAVGLFVRFVMPERRPLAVADVIEASALKGGRMPLGSGLAAALVSATSIGVGASVGREGPVVHLGATLASWLAARLRLGRAQQQTFLGCGVAAAIAASFNAPIAGVLFALEVVVGHYALGAFAPVVIAAVAGTLVSRTHIGNFAAFIVPPHHIVSLWEFPAFALLGVAGAATAILFMRAVMFTADAAERMPGPAWIRPALGGLAVGVIALAYPEVLGVGYAPTSDALQELLPLHLMLALVVMKTAATALSLGFGFGGGVFSPSLVIGAMLGGAFGGIATHALPELSSGPGAYTMVGMGAVAGAVLGAPISTVLIVFELTADYALTLAVMVAVVVASVLTQLLHGRSFFVWQLERRGLDPRRGQYVQLLGPRKVRELMDTSYDQVEPDADLAEVRGRLLASPHGEVFVTGENDRLQGTITFAELGEAAFASAEAEPRRARDFARDNPPVLLADDDLETVVRRLESIGEPHIAVVEDRHSMRMVGLVHERDIVLAYQRALADPRPG